MNAQFILDSIKRKYPSCAIVPEVSINSGPHRPYMRRIDGLMFDGNGMRTAIEVKTTLQDFQNESVDKVAPWKNVVHRFVYAVPEGLMSRFGDKHFLVTCGIWWVSESGVVTVEKNATVQKYPEPLPYNVITRLAYRAAGVKEQV